ncbi:non-ribosomal peptide synthetase [Azospirillum sp. B510]|uniref:non-ribosomal peptide synthetase n=1 Tax=Azospirillum sp. (strain B510) TaxID=137722 RepID=UPI0002ED4656|nr:non-ribosomal peptide synthetase [Azospirillum sp. B510]
MARNIEAAYPLTPLQEGLLFHTLSHPGEPTYFEQIRATIRGALDLHAFEAAWNQVIARHAILRSAFAWKGTQVPVQVVGARVTIGIDHDDWRDREDVGPAWDALLAEDRARGFDMARAPLMRLVLRRVAEDAHLFVWSHHHILLDGWSFGLVLHEVLSLYDGLARTGRPPALDPAPRFADFLGFLDRRDRAADDRFWREHLAGFTVPTRLAVDKGQGVHEGGSGTERIRDLLLDEETSTAIREACGRMGLSLSALVHGAWARLLSAYSGENEVAFGTTTAGRPPELPGVENMVGLFINAIPLRVRIDPQARVGSWLAGIQKDLLRCQEHQYCGLAHIQDLSEVERGKPLFETLLSFQNYPLDAAHAQSWGGIRLTDYGWTGPTNYPVAVRAFPGDRIMLVLTHYRHRLDDAVADAMLEQLGALVARLAGSPDRRLGDVGVLSEAQRWTMLNGWNDTARPHDIERTLHGLAEEQARRRPDATALVAGDGRMTYAELEAAANRLAHALVARGVAAGDLVGLCTEKSTATVVAMLAVMKAGAAYVPLDPNYPGERIRMMIEDARLALVLTWGKGSGAVSGVDARILDLAASGAEIDACPATPVGRTVAPDALAYVIYTSGSSGKPKGVMLDHRGRVNNVEDYCRMFDIGPDDRTLCVSSLSFDISVCDLFWTLHSGGSLVFPDPGREKDPGHWLDLIAREGITLWHSAPTLMDAMLDLAEEDPRPRDSLRLAVLDGDWIPLTQPDRVRRAFPGATVVSAGGATELSIDSVTYPIGEVRKDWLSIPYGRPMGNQCAYIVDENLQPAPVGVPGELLLGGVGMAMGYLGRPALTAEKFIPNPWVRAGHGGERLYRTGDLARYWPDGTIELLGRIDFQVKVRGVRIELGEIEATLRGHPAVAGCIVSAPKDLAGVRRLAAYLVAAEGAAKPDLPRLRGWLRQRVPEHLVPEAVVWLDRLPVSANGKVSRRDLPTPDFALGTDGFVAPATELERRLAAHWGKVLGLPPERVGAQTSFFDMGGNSLKALRACQFPDRPIPIAALYQYRTVRALAEHIEGGRTDGGILAELAAGPGEADAPVAICVPYGGGHAGVYQGLAEALDARMQVVSVRLPGHDHDASSEPLQSVREIGARVAEAAAEFGDRPILVYGHCGGVALATEIARRLENAGADLRGLVVAAAYPHHALQQPAGELFAGISDRDLAGEFAALGGFEDIGPDEAREIGRLLRHDGNEARRYFHNCVADALPRLSTPLTCLIGRDDPLTRSYESDWIAWRTFAERCAIRLMPGDHYFVRTHPQQVANELCAVLASTGDKHATSEKVTA